MKTNRKYIVQFVWGVSGILIMALILFGGLFYFGEQQRTPVVINESGFCGVPNLPEDMQRGKELFDQNCLACHKLEINILGPALKNTDHLVVHTWLFGEPNKKDQVEYGWMFHVQTFKDRISEAESLAISSYLNQTN